MGNHAHLDPKEVTMSLYRFLPTRIVKQDFYDRDGDLFRTDFKPQYRVIRWYDFKYRDEAGQQQSEVFSTVEGARVLLAKKTGAMPARKTVITVVE